MNLTSLQSNITRSSLNKHCCEWRGVQFPLLTWKQVTSRQQRIQWHSQRSPNEYACQKAQIQIGVPAFYDSTVQQIFRPGDGCRATVLVSAFCSFRWCVHTSGTAVRRGYLMRMLLSYFGKNAPCISAHRAKCECCLVSAHGPNYNLCLKGRLYGSTVCGSYSCAGCLHQLLQWPFIANDQTAASETLAAQRLLTAAACTVVGGLGLCTSIGHVRWRLPEHHRGWPHLAAQHASCQCARVTD
jgi:hypothetical protein